MERGRQQGKKERENVGGKIKMYEGCRTPGKRYLPLPEEYVAETEEREKRSIGNRKGRTQGKRKNEKTYEGRKTKDVGL